MLQPKPFTEESTNPYTTLACEEPHSLHKGGTSRSVSMVSMVRILRSTTKRLAAFQNQSSLISIPLHAHQQLVLIPPVLASDRMPAIQRVTDPQQKRNHGTVGSRHVDQKTLSRFQRFEIQPFYYRHLAHQRGQQSLGLVPFLLRDQYSHSILLM
jgi:hypothetical protein